MSKNQGIAAAGGQVWRSFSPTSCSVQGQTRAGCSGSRPVRIRVFPKTVHSLSRQTVLTLDHLTIKRGFSINFFLIFKLVFLFFQFVSTEKHWEESGFSFFTLLQHMLMYSTGPSSNPRGAPPMSDLQQDFVLLITTLLAQQLSHFSILLTVYSSNTYFICLCMGMVQRTVPRDLKSREGIYCSPLIHWGHHFITDHHQVHQAWISTYLTFHTII